MADIFLSYSRADDQQATHLARCLKGEGWTVFWDRDIPPGKTWLDVLDAELAKARCVVVIWTESSAGSEWVLYEARNALTRDVLVPVRSQPIELPRGFEHIQAADLSHWTGDGDAVGYRQLIATIRNLIGGHADIRLTPSQVVLVTGERATHQELGPTVNMTCTLSNDARQPVVLKRLDLLVTENDEEIYQMVWNLLYDTSGFRHIEVNESMNIPVAGRRGWTKGVQFREPRKQLSSVWSAGEYDFELRGWVSRRLSEQPNVITRFRAVVDDNICRVLRQWRDAGRERYDMLRDPDRAFGQPLPMEYVREGL